MHDVLVFFDKPLSKSDGISSHCDALIHLFDNDESFHLRKANNFTRKFLPFFGRHIYPNVFALYQYIRKSSSEIVHVHGLASFCSMEVIIAAKLAKKKVAFSPHYHPFDKMNHPLRMSMFWKVILRPVVSLCDVIITINHEDTSFFSRFFRNVSMIPHWITSEPISNQYPKKKSNMILFVGRNDDNKRLDMLYDLPENLYEVHCVTNGNVLRSDFILHRNISFDELSSLYNEASLVIVPSRYEAFSLVALESLSHNTPILVSDNVKIIDHLHGCRCGYATFPYNDKVAMYSLIEQTIGSPVDTDFVTTYFSKSRVKKLYQQVYSFLCAK